MLSSSWPSRWTGFNASQRRVAVCTSVALQFDGTRFACSRPRMCLRTRPLSLHRPTCMIWPGTRLACSRTLEPVRAPYHGLVAGRRSSNLLYSCAETAKSAGGGGPIDFAAEIVATCITGLHDVLANAGVPGPSGVSIIMFTLIIKAVLFPLNYQQIKSTTQMQKIQPKVTAIRQKYGDQPSAMDQNAMNQEIAQLYQDEELNPLAGCLPSLAQIPVFIALYRALINLSKADKLEESFLWIPSLEGPVKEQGMGLSWLTDWSSGGPMYGWHDTAAYLVLPVLLIVAQSLSFSILTPPTDDPNQKRTQEIFKFLPVVIGFFSLSTPSGLVVYWVTNSLVTTLQTVVIRQLLGYKPPEPATATPSTTPMPGTKFTAGASAQAKGFGAFKTTDTVDLSNWPSTKERSKPAPPKPPVVDVDIVKETPVAPEAAPTAPAAVETAPSEPEEAQAVAHAEMGSNVDHAEPVAEAKEHAADHEADEPGLSKSALKRKQRVGQGHCEGGARACPHTPSHSPPPKKKTYWALRAGKAKGSRQEEVDRFIAAYGHVAVEPFRGRAVTCVAVPS